MEPANINNTTVNDIPPPAPSGLWRLLPHRWPRRVQFTVAAVSALFLVGLFFFRTYAPVTVSAPLKSVNTDSAVAIKLSQVLSSIDTTKINITPAIEGTWSHQRGNLIASDNLVFTPKHYFKQDTTYKVKLPQAQRLLGGTAVLPTFNFTTEKAPSIDATYGVGSWQEGQIIAADTTFDVVMTARNNKARVLELRTNPAIKTALSIADDKKYSWKPNQLLPQDTTLTIEVYDTKNNESLLKRTVRTAAEPTITSPLHRTNVDKNSAIDFVFTHAIDPATANITIDTPGEGAWQNETMYSFKPTAITPATTYHYTITKGLRSKAGGLLTADIQGSFTTIGHVAVIATSPRGNNLTQGKQTISFTFSRPVDKQSAEQRLSVSAGTLSDMRWSGNTLSATVADIGFQQTFSATIAAGVVNTSFGLPSNQPYSLGFTTEARSARLNVPFYRQQHSGTCTAASLRMILSFRGINSDEIGIVNQMGYNPRSKDTTTNPATWDDPQTMFVGNIDGSIKDGTAAGPDAPPVAKAAQAYGRSAQAVTGIGASWIAQQIYAGNPVVMFGAFKATGMTTWQTPTGGTATMNLTGHATVVTGVSGEPGNPLGFWVNDPLSGTSYWSTAAVETNISRDPYRQAVVVY